MSENEDSTATELVVKDRRHSASREVATQDVQATPMAMIAAAIEKGLPIETLDKLMDLQERWDRAQAKKSYDAAMATARMEFPEIKKSKRVSYEVSNRKPGDKDVEYFHETLEDLTSSLNPILGRHGLSYRWDIAQEMFESGSMLITVTCYMTEQAGHTQQVSMTAPPDDSGKKNRIQQIASTISYLERYTLKAVAGLAAGDDDDARLAHQEEVAAYDTDAWIDTIDEAFKAKDRAKVEEVRAALQEEAASGRAPKWALDMLHAHFASQLSSAKQAAGPAKKKTNDKPEGETKNVD